MSKLVQQVRATNGVNLYSRSRTTSGRSYSGCMPASRANLIHFYVSASIKPLRSSGVMGRGTVPAWANLSTRSFCFRALSIAV